MWVISEEQMGKIRVSMLQQRKYRTFRILSKEKEFAKMPKEELKEKIEIYAGMVAHRSMSEAVLLEFIMKCIKEPEILEYLSVDWIVTEIENDI